MSTPTSECEILTPRDPSLDANTDEWPEFVLSNVHVHLPGNHHATVSLLEACAGYPLTVTGQLEPLDDDDSHLYRRQPGKKHPYILLEDVRMFSYGQYGDGSIAIWAAGKAGWYTIVPGQTYTPTFQQMVAAVKVLYFVADCYREPRRKGKGRTAVALPDYTTQELFEKYAAEELGSSDPADGAETIYEHKQFLILSMLGGKEGLTWSKFPLYKHLYAKFPDLFAHLRQRVAGPEAPQSRNSRQASVDTIGSEISSQRSKRGQTKNSSLETGPEAANEMQMDYPHSEAVAASTSRTIRRTRQNSAAASISDEHEKERVTMSTKDDETDDEVVLRPRKNKSSLRPRASKSSKSAAREGGKGLTGGAAEDGDDDDSGDGGDVAESSPSPTSTKRKSFESAYSRRPPKRRNSKPHLDEGIDIPTSPSISEDVDGAALSTIPTDATAASYGSEATDLAIRTLAHVPDPVQEDTWVCALDGCTHKVYAASQPDSQRLIREHYALHAYDDDERVQMVKKLQAPSLPVGHLMERIKLQAKMEGFPGSRQLTSRYPTKVSGVTQRY